MKKSTLPYWFFGAAIISVLLHNAIYGVFKIEEPVFFTAAFLFIFASIVAVIYNLFPNKYGAIVVILLIVVSGFLAVRGLTLMEKVSNNQQTPVIGGDKDAHGCLVAASYSWCEEKQKCLRIWEEGCGSAPTQ